MTALQVRRVALAGLACITVGLFIALAAPLADGGPSTGGAAVGWVMLVLGIAGASATTGFVVGARRGWTTAGVRDGDAGDGGPAPTG